jgi:hypothetical protein
MKIQLDKYPDLKVMIRKEAEERFQQLSELEKNGKQSSNHTIIFDQVSLKVYLILF